MLYRIKVVVGPVEFVGADMEFGAKLLEATRLGLRDIYQASHFELECDDGAFVIFPAEVIRHSIVILEKAEENGNE